MCTFATNTEIHDFYSEILLTGKLTNLEFFLCPFYTRQHIVFQLPGNRHTLYWIKITLSDVSGSIFRKKCVSLNIIENGYNEKRNHFNTNDNIPFFLW